MKIALVPINPIVGDVAGNARLVGEALRAANADLVVFPELAICGYPPRDLLLHAGFVAACESAVEELARSLANGPAVLLGTPLANGGGLPTNGLALLRGGEVAGRYAKRLLPNYEVFDEQRYFAPGREPGVIELGGLRVGLAICEDLWRGLDARSGSRYAGAPDPLDELRGVDLLIAPSASPFVDGKHALHAEILRDTARALGCPVLSVNQHGANDDLIFDGSASAVNAAGEAVARNERWSGEPVTIETGALGAATPLRPVDHNRTDMLIEALTLGTHDYARKTGFTTACLGLSGGIDSAVTAAIAARALGAGNLMGFALPGPYSSKHAFDDAKDLAKRLGCVFEYIEIGDPFAACERALRWPFSNLRLDWIGARQPDITEQNLQSRLRGTLMMAVSNRTGAMLLTTGNKSELAVGYCTLYGDMNGGLAVLSDVLKQDVYAIARRLNEAPDRFGFDRPPIPASTIDKPPSAELAPGQLDSDTLPPYDELDEIVRRFVEHREPAETIAAEAGIARETVDRVLRLIRLNEYKRFQYAVGLKVSPVAFGRGRRMPLAGP